MTLPTRLIRLWLGACIKSTRWNICGSLAGRTMLTTPGQGSVVAFWHRSLTLSPALLFWARRIEPRLALRVLISRNRDGMLIAEALRPWGVVAIHGSSGKRGKNKGGAAALRRALKELKSGSLMVITPDGPRGPAEVVQQGVIVLSRMTESAVVPIGIASSGVRLPSWDGLTFPIPFGRGVIIIGTPLHQPDALTLTAALKDVSLQAEQALRAHRTYVVERIWGAIGTILAPSLIAMLRIRVRRGKENPDRLRERMGLGTGRRSSGALLWVHAASVGETLCALPLVDRLLSTRPKLNILLTTATLTGAEIVSRHSDSNGRLTHRFIPYDVPRWTRRFLDRWQPDGAVFVESELWPGILFACTRRDIPVMLVNGRMSDRSAHRWGKLKGAARQTMRTLRWVAARSHEDALRFRTLGANPVFEDGDLKRDAPALSFDPAEYERLKAVIGQRPVFVAASTHPGEEDLILRAAERARQSRPDLLTIIIPRHPTRGESLSQQFGLPLRSRQQDPETDTPVWLADTLGELGLFYRLAERCFVGNSLAGKGGGHNPFEPLRLNVPTATGPLMDNWREAMAALSDTITVVNDEECLTRWLEFPRPDVNTTGLQHSVAATLTERILETIDR